MNQLTKLPAYTIASFLVATPFALSTSACTSGGDVPIGKTSTAIKGTDGCPSEKCANEAVACAPSQDGTVRTASNARCVAGPQDGSGVGTCRVAFDCAPEPVLKEGDLCPDEKCADQGFGCPPKSDGNPLGDGSNQQVVNLRCVAGPQTGSGIGLCHLQGECVPNPPDTATPQEDRSGSSASEEPGSSPRSTL